MRNVKMPPRHPRLKPPVRLFNTRQLAVGDEAMITQFEFNNHWLPTYSFPEQDAWMARGQKAASCLSGGRLARWRRNRSSASSQLASCLFSNPQVWAREGVDPPFPEQAALCRMGLKPARYCLSGQGCGPRSYAKL